MFLFYMNLEKDERECSVCFEVLDFDTCMRLKCGHVFHIDCLKKILHLRCPLCRSEINPNVLFGEQQLWCCCGNYSPCLKDGPCRFCYGVSLGRYTVASDS